MYASFNLKVNIMELFTDKYFHYKEMGLRNKYKIEDEVHNILHDYTMNNGVLDGTKISDKWFKIVKRDVFLSYSRKDCDVVYALSGWLSEEFGLTVFVDEFVWNHMDDLLKGLDHLKSKTREGFYSYEKRNVTTSHIHSMLSVAILHAMDNAECIFFLNTDNSIPDIDDAMKESGKYTKSPWLYTELIATQLIRQKPKEVYRQINKSLTEDALFEAGREIEVAYKVPIEKLTLLNAANLCKWHSLYKAQKYDESVHPLDVLYEIVRGDALYEYNLRGK